MSDTENKNFNMQNFIKIRFKVVSILYISGKLMSTSRAICKLQMSSHYNIKYMGQLIILFSSLEYASLYFKYMAKQVKDNVYILKIIS